MGLLIVDGLNLLFQMFYGMPSRIKGKSGQAIQGILGFTGALIRIIKLTEPDGVAVLFDGEHENSRSVLSHDYKSNRIDYGNVPDEDNPFSQLKDIYAALDFMGIAHTETEEGEADDAIASYAFSYGGEMNITIASQDSDFFQLISERVSVLRYRGDKSELCGVEYVKNKFGVSPAQYADFKSMVGDASDNIKGVEKIGPKTAGELLRRFGSLESIIENSDGIEKPAVSAAIKQNVERLRLNYSLIKLHNEVEISFNIDKLSYKYDGISTNEVLTKIGVK